MNSNEEKLMAGLKALAFTTADAPPPELEALLLRRLRQRRKFPWLIAAEVIAAAAILVIAIVSHPSPAAADGFVSVPYSAPLASYESVAFVHVNVPVSALAQWGIPVSTLDPSQRVDADVVIGEDGLARAVRLTNKP